MSDETEDRLSQESNNDVVLNLEENAKPNNIKPSFNSLKRYDSLDVEAGKFGRQGHAATAAGGGWAALLPLAFQSIGIVYGDIGTSPLYVFPSVFPNGIQHSDDILGVTSIIFYTLTFLPLIKYVFIVLNANDNGEGGTFALYSLLCRHAKVSLVPNQQKEDQEVSNFRLELPNNRTKVASKLKSALENSNFAKYCLLFVTMLGTSMLIGDGVLTPCISVLSAMGGLHLATKAMTEDRIVWASVVILIFLFMIQRFGTDKVGYTFAPILFIWFCFISVIGVYNIVHHDPSIIKALYPKYIIDYFLRNKTEAWISLGGTILCVTGAEALFADVGHFSVAAIQISTCAVVYPSVVLAYAGQAAYLRKHNDDVSSAFYSSTPHSVYWPMFVVAVMASIIASQSLISGTFSIIQQSLSLGCFPRVKVVHTSTKYPGQVYVPEMNYLLMLACIFVTLGFKNTIKIGNAYGIAVVFVMVLTSSFLVLVMILVWKTHILLVIAYILIIGSIELVYLSSVLYKFDQGGYLPIAFAMFLMTVMFVWNYVYRKRYFFELKHKISPERVNEIVRDAQSQRLPGLAIFYSELVHGIPPIFEHYVDNVPALHSVLIFVSFKSLPVSKVPIEERFLFRRVHPKELQVFRCVVRYGYTDVRNDEQEPLELLLVDRVKEFIREDYDVGPTDEEKNGEREREDEIARERDIEAVDKAWRSGVVHFVGEHEVVAGKGSNVAKRILINYAYNFLKANLRQSNKVFDIPQKRMLKVGMTYQL